MNTDERSTKIICEAIQWFVYCFQVSLESFITDFLVVYGALFGLNIFVLLVVVCIKDHYDLSGSDSYPTYWY